MGYNQKNNPEEVKIKVNGKVASVQNPLPADRDSVYGKDIWVDESTVTNWADTDSSGDNIATIPFNNLHTRITNSTSDNPKILLIHFNRTISAHQIGLGCYEGVDSFSNVKIELLGSSGEVRTTVDESSSNIKYNSRNYQFKSGLFNAIKLTFYTADEICISNITIQKATYTLAQIEGEDEITGEVDKIQTYRKALKVDNALVHRQGVNLFFFQPNGVTTTLASATTTEDTSIDVVDSTGFSIGDKVKLTGTIDTGQTFMTITDITGNTITLDRPVGSALVVGKTVEVVYVDMNVAGTLASPEIFKISPPTTNGAPKWQLTRMLINITDGTTMDDGKFGGLTALTNGVNIRVVKGDGSIQDLTNWKTNGDLALDMYDVEYTQKAPAGQYGLRGRWTFTKAEFFVELDGANGDYLELRVQDDLTGLLNFNIKAQGRLFGE